MGSADLVLIAMVNNKRDLHIASTQHWYRIPVKNAPRQLEEMKYIAFYQTKAFGDQKWTIYYWAEIKKIKIVKRLELMPHEDDHPKADDQYYKVEIGHFRRLPEPIVSKKGLRVAFISTTLEKFRAAKEMDEFFRERSLESDEESRI